MNLKNEFCATWTAVNCTQKRFFSTDLCIMICDQSPYYETCICKNYCRRLQRNILWTWCSWIVKLSVMYHVCCMVCLLIILTEPLGLLSLENCFLYQWKMWRTLGQKGSDWTRGQHVRVENFKVFLLSRTSSTMPDGGKSKLILVVNFESHKTVTRQYK